MTTHQPLLAYGAPPMGLLFLLLACCGFCVITSMLRVVLPFALFEGPALWKPMLMINGISILILFTLGIILHTSHPLRPPPPNRGSR